MSKLHKVRTIDLNGNSVKDISTSYGDYIKYKQETLITQKTYDKYATDIEFECLFIFNRQHDENVLYDMNYVDDVAQNALTRDITKKFIDTNYGLTITVNEDDKSFTYTEDSLNSVDKSKIFLSSMISKNREKYFLSEGLRLNLVPSRISEIFVSNKISEFEISDSTKLSETKIHSNSFDLSKDTVNLNGSTLVSKGSYLKHGLSSGTLAKSKFERIYLSKNFFTDKNLETSSQGDFGDFSESTSKIYINSSWLFSPLKGLALRDFLCELLKSENVSTTDVECVYYSGSNPEIIHETTSKEVIILPDPYNKPTGLLSDLEGNLTDKLVRLSLTIDISGFGLFENCSRLTSISLATTVENLGTSTFKNCSALENIFIPSSVTNLGEGTFDNCTSLKNVVCLMTSIKPISAFKNLNVESLEVDPTAPESVVETIEFVFSVENAFGLMYYSGENPVIDNSKNYACQIKLLPDPVDTPSGVMTKTGDGNLSEKLISLDLQNISEVDGVFNNSTVLTALTIGDTVKTLGNNTFNNCSSLKIFDTNAVLTSIGSSAFKNCTAISTLDISQAEVLGSYAFDGCSQLKSLTLFSTLTAINDGCFQNCGSLTGDLVIPSGVEIIGENAFNGCSKLSSLELNESLVMISSGAFNNCKALTGDLVIPDLVEVIDDNAFNSCSKLTSIDFGTSIRVIGEHAFANCSGLTGTILIPDTIESIETNAFDGCSLATIIVQKS